MYTIELFDKHRVTEITETVSKEPVQHSKISIKFALFKPLDIAPSTELSDHLSRHPGLETRQSKSHKPRS